MTDNDYEDSMTLDPPGSIVVIGAGPLGIEAALYGRYLGFDVHLLEANEVGASLRDHAELPLPMLPDRCLSPLAQSALRAQNAAASETGGPLPITFADWVDDALVSLSQSDLLRNRLTIPARVTRIDPVTVEADHEDEDLSEIPPDFQLTYVDATGQSMTRRAEAVIRATGNDGESSVGEIAVGFSTAADYFFQIGTDRRDDAESDLQRGYREIVSIFAGLMGRADLDLYRPRRT